MPRTVQFLVFAVLAGGCHFGRTVVNAHVRQIDTSWIKPGQTTRTEVVERIGLPPTVKTLGGVRKDSFRWVMVDTDERILRAGWVVTPTFEKTREHFAEDILVKFDGSGVVSLVSRTRSDGDRVEILELRETPQ
ncbi:MAG: hypothetical protein J6T01_00515 [Kiritimatiellae bacterium]|nr:hypothetical protein [Kiritimatiellia bacterium]